MDYNSCVAFMPQIQPLGEAVVQERLLNRQNIVLEKKKKHALIERNRRQKKKLEELTLKSKVEELQKRVNELTAENKILQQTIEELRGQIFCDNKPVVLSDVTLPAGLHISPLLVMDGLPSHVPLSPFFDPDQNPFSAS